MFSFFQKSDQGKNGFVSKIGQTFNRLTDVAIDTAGEVLPIWAAHQLGLQQTNQLDNPTFQTPLPVFNSNNNLTTEDVREIFNEGIAGVFSQSTPNPNTGSAGGKTVTLTEGNILLIAGGLFLGLILLRSG